MAETVYILSGSNVGDRERILEAALSRLEGLEGLEVIAYSAIYLSEAQDMEGENPTFLNQVIKGEYQYSPHELLEELEKIEAYFGREDKGLNQPRTLDLDILLFGDQQISTEHLTVPHPELLNRPFAMVPLLQIDADLVHPVEQRPIADFLSDEGASEIMLFKDHVARSV